MYIKSMCLLTASLLTASASSQGHKPEPHAGWIVSEAHPTPVTSSTVISADIAAGSRYVLVEDGTNKVLRVQIGPAAAEINDNAQPPPGTVHQPIPQLVLGGDQFSQSASAIQNNAPAGSSQQSDLRDPCSLLTSAELSDVLDRQGVSTGFLNRRDPHTCIWNLSPPDRYPFYVRLTVLSVAQFKAIEADMGKLAGAEKVEGVGEDAFSVNNKSNGGTVGGNVGQHSELFVLKGSAAFVVMTGGPTVPSVVPTLVAAAKALGLKVAEKL